MEPEVTDYRLYELYYNWCQQNKVKASVKGFVQWVEENY